MQDHASNQYFTKDELEQIRRWFTEDQQKDVLDLGEQCAKTPRGRIRKPRVRKPVPGHIGRPINSFMAYRSKIQADIRYFCPTANHRIISKIIAKWWKAIDEKEKNIYRAIADKAKKDHLEKHPGYTFRPKPKKSKNSKKLVNAKAAGIKNDDDQDYKPSPPFAYMAEKDDYQHQQHKLSYCDLPIDENAVSSYYYPSIVNYVPVPLSDQDGSNVNNNEDDMYVDPALLNNGYMDINAAEPIHFDNDSDPTIYAFLSNSTPATQMLETPSLEYFQSPMSFSHQVLDHQSRYQQQMHQQQQQRQDTPYLLDHTIIPSDYSKEYGKLFDTLGVSDSASSSSDTLLHTPTSVSNQNIQTEDFIDFIYGTSNPNIVFTEPHNWGNINTNN